jgi:hypothetical protein
LESSALLGYLISRISLGHPFGAAETEMANPKNTTNVFTRQLWHEHFMAKDKSVA